MTGFPRAARPRRPEGSVALGRIRSSYHFNCVASSLLPPRNQMRVVPGAEAIVDVHDGDARGAAVQHREEGGQTLEGGAVADAGRHGDHRLVHQAADYTRERSIHPGDDDDGRGGVDLLPRIEETVQAGDT